MSRFPTAGHLVSWAGLCPRDDESAGKHHSTRLRGDLMVKTTLAASILTAIYHMLTDGTFYQDLGADQLPEGRTHYLQAKKLAQRIATLGFKCSIAPTAEEADDLLSRLSASAGLTGMGGWTEILEWSVVGS